MLIQACIEIFMIKNTNNSIFELNYLRKLYANNFDI